MQGRRQRQILRYAKDDNQSASATAEGKGDDKDNRNGKGNRRSFDYAQDDNVEAGAGPIAGSVEGGWTGSEAGGKGVDGCLRRVERGWTVA